VLEENAALVAAIGEEHGAAAGARAAETAAQAFKDGVAMGLSGEELQDYVEQEVGFELASGGGGQEITVQQGDTLWGISQETGIPLEDLIAANGGETLIVPGQVLTVGDGTTLISLNEGSVPETLQSAGTNVLGQIGTPTPAATTTTPAPTQSTAPTSDWTFYDPATQSYTYADNPEPMVTPEEAEVTAQVADDFLAAETSVNNIVAADTSATLDPLITDIDVMNTEIAEFEDSMTRITQADWTVDIPVRIAFEAETAEWISRNPTAIEAIRLMLPGLGVTPTQ
jgi:LysM repeat protein